QPKGQIVDIARDVIDVGLMPGRAQDVDRTPDDASDVGTDVNPGADMGRQARTYVSEDAFDTEIGGNGPPLKIRNVHGAGVAGLHGDCLSSNRAAAPGHR